MTIRKLYMNLGLWVMEGEGGELRLEDCSPHQQPPAEGAQEELAVGRPTPKLSIIDHSLLYKNFTE